MPKEYKYVCYKHRHVSKRSGHCPTCQNELYCLGDRARIPRKSDDAGWISLKEWIISVRNYDIEANKLINRRTWSERSRQADAILIGKK